MPCWRSWSLWIRFQNPYTQVDLFERPMRAIARRLTRIEGRLRPAAYTEHQRRLRARLDNARRRMAGETPRPEDIGATREVTRGWILSEILQRGRQMARSIA